MTTGYAEFEFDLPGALLTKLIEIFDAIDPAPLTSAFLEEIPEGQGVYQLWTEDKDCKLKLVYIGKTDSESGLLDRLHRHAKKLQNRYNLDPVKVKFKAVRIYVFTAVDLETQMINKYSDEDRPAWNNSGFGSNDPGYERETTKYKPKHFDTQYPINIDIEIDFDIPDQGTVAEYFKIIKKELPYLIRFQSVASRSRTPHEDLFVATLEIVRVTPLTPRIIIEQCLAVLPAGWKAMLLPSHVIIYKNDARNIVSGSVIAVSP
jgi:Uri superfamily endonuclease